jgi:hypothetical protein
MASGNILCWWPASASIPPASSFAPLTRRNNHLVAQFDDTADESVDFEGVLPDNYSAGGLTVRLVWLAASATTGTTRWEAQFERHEDDAVDLDSDSFASTQSAGGTAASVSGEPQYTDITFTNGAQIDSLAAGESFRLRVTRDANGTTGTDDMVGDAQLLRVILLET